MSKKYTVKEAIQEMESQRQRCVRDLDKLTSTDYMYFWSHGSIAALDFGLAKLRRLEENE